MRVEQLNDREKWNAFVAANGGGIMQSYEWGVFRHDFGWEPRYLVVKDGREIRLSAVVMHKPMPLGYSFFYSPEGPIVKGNDWRDKSNQAAFAALTEFLKEGARGQKVIFYKVDPHVSTDHFPLEWLDQQGFRDSREDIQPAVVAHVDLTKSEDDILAGMKQKGRYNIRYAARKGVKVAMGTSEEDLEAAYGLIEQTAKRQGITYRGIRYFKHFRERFMEDADLATFIIARYKGKPAAATMVSFFGDRSDYLYGGTSTEDRNVFASYLVQWAGIREAKKRGAKVYNMTGVAHADDPQNPWYGLRQFKLKFGPQVVDLPGARDQVYRPLDYFLFTNADRGRRLWAKIQGRARMQ